MLIEVRVKELASYRLYLMGAAQNKYLEFRCAKLFYKLMKKIPHIIHCYNAKPSSNFKNSHFDPCFDIIYLKGDCV